VASKLTSFLTVLALISTLFISPVYAAEVDTKTEKVSVGLRKGDKAPYEGVLLTLYFAADVRENCNVDVLKKRQDIAVKEAVGLAQNECTLTTSILRAEVSSEKQKFIDVISAKDKEIEHLREIASPPAWYESPKLWFAVGLVLGAGTVIYVANTVTFK